MSKFIIVQNLKTLRRGPNRGLEDEVVFLHKLLNYHLGPPDDQLPMVGPDASAFGPRTEAKVKKFQEVNKIDFGTKNFKDGVVGPHTWKVLTETFRVTGIILAAPQLRLKPPTFPPNLQIPKPPQPILIPVPKLTLPTIQVQLSRSTGIRVSRVRFRSLLFFSRERME
jgi:murein L,D-transpeptidase YcbB/YkuD